MFIKFPFVHSLSPTQMIHTKYSSQKQFEIQYYQLVINNWSFLISAAQVIDRNWSPSESRIHDNKPGGNTRALVDLYSILVFNAYFNVLS